MHQVKNVLSCEFDKFMPHLIEITTNNSFWVNEELIGLEMQQEQLYYERISHRDFDLI